MVGLCVGCGPEAGPGHASASPRASISASGSAEPAPPIDAAAIEAGRRGSVVKSDERVVLFPAYASRAPDGRTWKLELGGWIFEPETGDVLRNKAVGKLKVSLGLMEGSAAARVFEERVRPFFADNERGKTLSVELAGRVFALPASDEDGQLVGSLELDDALARAHADGGTLTARVLLRPGDDRAFTTTVRLVEPEGLTIVSDIDDTVKVTEVRDTAAVARRTFTMPFEPVPGMAPKYRAWLGSDGHLHFVSSSPWQLYPALGELTHAAGFPVDATFSLKRIRPRDVLDSLDTLLADPTTTKPDAIRAILDRFPKRRFVLVGDSGEKDPEVYAPFLRDHPDRIVRVYVRDVTGEPRTAPRYVEVFKGLPADKWVIFGDASQLPGAP
jgi:phosphatidate phosphatase APP1